MMSKAFLFQEIESFTCVVCVRLLIQVAREITLENTKLPRFLFQHITLLPFDNQTLGNPLEMGIKTGKLPCPVHPPDLMRHALNGLLSCGDAETRGFRADKSPSGLQVNTDGLTLGDV